MKLDQFLYKFKSALTSFQRYEYFDKDPKEFVFEISIFRLSMKAVILKLYFVQVIQLISFLIYEEKFCKVLNNFIVVPIFKLTKTNQDKQSFNIIRFFQKQDEIQRMAIKTKCFILEQEVNNRELRKVVIKDLLIL